MASRAWLNAVEPIQQSSHQLKRRSLPPLRQHLLGTSGAKATALRTLRDRSVSGPREASGLRRVHRRFSKLQGTTAIHLPPANASPDNSAMKSIPFASLLL